ncbi:MAG: lysophospholipid acyltransferase family protein [Pseudomonadota bacterium]|uniref:lysophospholipid acyltransferase family protein n=1 Tax=Fodinicurvata fenggangensis TaxID=1121830 RepID=UPI0005502FB2|nr:lysophospholipid acyltransferase family protein [Fodinicurvata fenggangensis]
MTHLRSLVFNGLFYAWTTLLALAYLPLLFLPPRYIWAACRFWARSVFFLLRTIVGLDWRLEGRTHLPDGAALIASKHQSAWDTLVFVLLLDRPVYILKQELLQIPLFSTYLKHMGMIAIDRRGAARTLRSLQQQARARLAEGRPVIIFPEGTRTRPGETRPYQPGVAALYKALEHEAPLVPAALNSGHFWGRRSFLKYPGCITLRILPPIPGGLSRNEVMAQLHESIEDASRALADLPGQNNTPSA